MTYCRADVSSGGIEKGKVVRRKLTCKSRIEDEKKKKVKREEE